MGLTGQFGLGQEAFAGIGGPGVLTLDARGYDGTVLHETSEGSGLVAIGGAAEAGKGATDRRGGHREGASVHGGHAGIEILNLRVAGVHSIDVELDLHAHGGFNGGRSGQGAAAIDLGQIVLLAFCHQPVAVVSLADIALADVAKSKTPSGCPTVGRGGLPDPVANLRLEAVHLHAIRLREL